MQAPETCDDGCLAGLYSKDYPGCGIPLPTLGTQSTNCNRNTCTKCPPCLAVGGDGCSSGCTIEDGYDCAVATDIGYVCQSECGDGVTAGIEMCDDGNSNAGDGCFGCEIELGWDCKVSLSSGVLLCNPICGDGVRVGTEQCDDGNRQWYDGCSFFCTREPGFECDGSSDERFVQQRTPDSCTARCGDFVQSYLVKGQRGWVFEHMSNRGGLGMRGGVDSAHPLCTRLWRRRAHGRGGMRRRQHASV